MFGFSMQELIVVAIVIGVLSSTGLWPRIIQGIRELRGDVAPGGGVSQQDLDMCYKILGVCRSSKRSEIENAYRRKAQIHHPDKGGDEDAMRVLNDVYSKLKKVHRSRQ